MRLKRNRGWIAAFLVAWCGHSIGACTFGGAHPPDYELPADGGHSAARAGTSGLLPSGGALSPAAGSGSTNQNKPSDPASGQGGAAAPIGGHADDGGAPDTPTRAFATWFAAIDDANAPILGVELPGVAPLEGVTVRQIAHVSVGGDAMRIRFTNEYGVAPVTFSKVHVGKSASGAAIDVTTDTAVTFNGATSVTIQPKTAVWTDDIALPIRAADDVAVSIYVEGSADIASEHRFAQRTNYVALGDVVTTPDLADGFQGVFLQEIESSYWMSEIVVVRDEPVDVVVAFGDSITDGFESTPGANLRYPDQLSKLLASEQSGPVRSVVNAGIGGNRWLHGGLGPAAADRFMRDALSVSSVSDVVIMLGINDIGFGVFSEAEAVTVELLTAAISAAVGRARKAGLRVYLGTLPPFGDCLYYTDEGEGMRQALNAWILSNKEVSGLVDFDRALRDPANTRMFAPQYDSGDHLHPSDAGYAAMAEVVERVLRH